VNGGSSTARGLSAAQAVLQGDRHDRPRTAPDWRKLLIPCGLRGVNTSYPPPTKMLNPFVKST
jgi:hypothetical protein